MAIADEVYKENLDLGFKVMKMNNGKKPDIDTYELVAPMFHALFAETKELSRKQANGTINEFKINHINRVLQMVLDLVKDEPTAHFLELLATNDPQKQEDRLKRISAAGGLTYSDVVIVLSQYNVALNKYREKYIPNPLDWKI